MTCLLGPLKPIIQKLYKKTGPAEALKCARKGFESQETPYALTV